MKHCAKCYVHSFLNFFMEFIFLFLTSLDDSTTYFIICMILMSLLNKAVVVDCWWENGNRRCRGEEGYLYNEKFSTYLVIPMATNNKTYNYSCWHDGSHGDQVKTCSFVIHSNGVQHERSNASKFKAFIYFYTLKGVQIICKIMDNCLV